MDRETTKKGNCIDMVGWKAKRSVYTEDQGWKTQISPYKLFVALSSEASCISLPMQYHIDFDLTTKKIGNNLKPLQFESLNIRPFF